MVINYGISGQSNNVLAGKETSSLITILYTRKGMNMERGEKQYFLDMVYVPGLLHRLPHFMLIEKL